MMKALSSLPNSQAVVWGSKPGGATRTWLPTLRRHLMSWLNAYLPVPGRRKQRCDDFVLRDSDGRILARGLSEDRYCAGLAHIAEVYADRDSLADLKTHNDAMIDRLLHRDRATKLEAVIAERVARARSAEKVAAQLFGNGGACDITCIGMPEARNHAPGSSTRGQFVPGRDHLFLVAASPCVVCGTRPAQPHRLTFAGSGASRGQQSDLWVPLCVSHLNQLCAFGMEEAWWHIVGIDPIAAARTLWQKSAV